MTSRLLDALWFLGVTVGLFWLGFCWMVAFGSRLMHVLAPLWRRLIHEFQMRSLRQTMKSAWNNKELDAAI